MIHFRKKLLFVAKVLFSLGALYVLYSQIEWDQFFVLFQGANWWWIGLSFLVLNIAQFFSALRMQFYYKSADQHLSFTQSISLYYIGMLFNMVLPGGIGGDGYKALRLKRDLGVPFRTSVRLLISGRASGLLLLILIGLGFGLASVLLPAIIPYVTWLIILAAVITILGYLVSTRLLLKERLETQLGAAGYSFVVQLLVAICAACLFQALNASYDWSAQGFAPDYLMLFMISSLVSVLPISIGGIGLRELTFFYGAQFLSLNAEVGVAVALLYFVVNLAASLIGLIFFFSFKLKKEEPFAN